tara:strand:- start:110 stop:688 length:579 start_codon:yes stop_codon:yes gene_type:complete
MKDKDTVKSPSSNSILGSVDGEVLTYKRRNYQQAPPKEQVRGRKFNLKKRSVGNTSPPIEHSYEKRRIAFEQREAVREESAKREAENAKVLCLVAGLKNKKLRKHHQDIIEIGDNLAEEKAKKSFSKECEHLQWLLTTYVRNTKLPYETRELALNQIRRSSVVETLSRELLGEEIFEKHYSNALKERASTLK